MAIGIGALDESLLLAVPIASIILVACIVAIALPAIVIGVLRQDGYSKRYQRHQIGVTSPLH